MGKKLITVGIDVSKARLDASLYNGNKHKSEKFANNVNGFKDLSELIDKTSGGEKAILMESTGIYHLKLAIYLCEKGYKVSVLNPYIIKRYSDMLMRRSKTDRLDARLIAEYGYENISKLQEFSPNKKEQYEISETLKTISYLRGLIADTKNKLEALSHHPYPDGNAVKELKKTIKSMEESIKRLLSKMEKKLNKNYNKENEQLLSIPGIGTMLSASIISMLGSFKNFENAKKVCAYLGICPGVEESGTSVKGKGNIGKQGNRYIRKLLYMCSISAMKHNKSCRDLAERLKKKGKKFKEIAIAVANKLIRQAYGIIKNDSFYNEDYCCNTLK